MQIKHVRQKHAYGCGIACAAMVAGCTYDHALRVYASLYANTSIHDNLYSDKGTLLPLAHRNLDRLLTALGLTPVRDLDAIYGEVLPDNVYIMAIPPTSGRVGHYVVLDTRGSKYILHDPQVRKGAAKFPTIWSTLVKVIKQ